MLNFAHKGVRVSVMPKPWPVGGHASSRPARRKSNGPTCHMAVASMGPARGNGRTRGLVEEKRNQGKRDGRVVRKKKRRLRMLMMLFLSAGCLTGGTTWVQP
jgi:hypothetical protein